MSGTYELVDPQVDAQVDRRAQVVFEVLALELADGLLEQLHVHLEADGIDVTALLAAEQIAGAADLEVERRHAEAAAEVAELLDRREPLLRDRRQIVFRRNQQIGVRGPIGSPDAAAQLIELRQAVAVGAVDDDRVGVRDVEAVLDDRRRQQDVELPARRNRASRARARPRPSARGRRRRALRARGAGSGCRSRRSTRRGCGRSTPGRRARARCGSRGR